MEARIAAVRQSLWLLLVASAVCAVVTLPHPGNRTYMRALREVTAFSRAFQPEAAEAKLLVQARAQGSQPLRLAAPTDRIKRAPLASVSEDALPIAPLASLGLSSLAELEAYSVETHSAEAPTVRIGVPDLKTVPTAVSWRLSRRAPVERIVLTAARVVPAEVSETDVTREALVAQAARASADAEHGVRDAEKKLEQANSVLEARQKRRMPWKAIAKAREGRVEAQATFDEKNSAAEAAKTAYEGLAAAALAAHAPSNTPAIPAYALLRVAYSADGAAEELEVPVAVLTRDVPVKALTGVAFDELKSAGMWESVKRGDARAAIAAVDARFNWHMHRVTVWGLDIPGALVLQCLPCFLPLLLWLLLSRIRALAVSYSPFTTTVRRTLPRPGFKSRALELLAVLGLPLLACACAAAALLLIDRSPVLPVLSAGFSFFLGVRAFGKLSDLEEWLDSVVQSHSYPPL